LRKINLQNKVIEDDEIFIAHNETMGKVKQIERVLEENDINYAAIFNGFEIITKHYPAIALRATNMSQTSVAFSNNYFGKLSNK
jgi:hypothetical protein